MLLCQPKKISNFQSVKSWYRNLVWISWNRTFLGLSILYNHTAHCYMWGSTFFTTILLTVICEGQHFLQPYCSLLYVRVNILLACRKTLAYDRILWLWREVWAHKTSLILPLFIEMSVQPRRVRGHAKKSEGSCQEEWGIMPRRVRGHAKKSEGSYLCVSGVLI
jgi:hypothetical protein